MFDNSVQVTRGSQEPVIVHLVFNLTSKVDRNGSVTHTFESGPPKDHFNSNFDVIFLKYKNFFENSNRHMNEGLTLLIAISENR
jgi:hypothetical protein